MPKNAILHSRRRENLKSYTDHVGFVVVVTSVSLAIHSTDCSTLMTIAHHRPGLVQ
jgi:hypothetical protein